jgi:phosphoglycerate dehydrogenase-like enzyme
VVGDYDAMIIRSGVKVTGEVLAKPGRLRVIARAGVGVDNVNLDAATSAGVLVINTPDANTLTTAEHTIAMMPVILGGDRKCQDGSLGSLADGRAGRINQEVITR